MTEGTTCYERDEALCEDQMCLRTGCCLRNEREGQPHSSTVTTDISMQDVRLVAGEGKLTARQVLDSVNIILRQRAERGAPAQSQPDPEDRTIFVLQEIARGRFDNGRPLSGETARQMARSALDTWPGRTSTVPSTKCLPAPSKAIGG